MFSATLSLLLACVLAASAQDTLRCRDQCIGLTRAVIDRTVDVDESDRYPVVKTCYDRCSEHRHKFADLYHYVKQYAQKHYCERKTKELLNVLQVTPSTYPVATWCRDQQDVVASKWEKKLWEKVLKHVAASDEVESKSKLTNTRMPELAEFLETEGFKNLRPCTFAIERLYRVLLHLPLKKTMHESHIKEHLREIKYFLTHRGLHQSEWQCGEIIPELAFVIRRSNEYQIEKTVQAFRNIYHRDISPIEYQNIEDIVRKYPVDEQQLQRIIALEIPIQKRPSFMSTDKEQDNKDRETTLEDENRRKHGQRQQSGNKDMWFSSFWSWVRPNAGGAQVKRNTESTSQTNTFVLTSTQSTTVQQTERFNPTPSINFPSTSTVLSGESSRLTDVTATPSTQTATPSATVAPQPQQEVTITIRSHVCPNWFKEGKSTCDNTKSSFKLNGLEMQAHLRARNGYFCGNVDFTTGRIITYRFFDTYSNKTQVLRMTNWLKNLRENSIIACGVQGYGTVYTPDILMQYGADFTEIKPGQPYAFIGFKSQQTNELKHGFLPWIVTRTSRSTVDSTRVNVVRKIKLNKYMCDDVKPKQCSQTIFPNQQPDQQGHYKYCNKIEGKCRCHCTPCPMSTKGMRMVFDRSTKKCIEPRF